uniref:Uncharacterized protein LOC111103264 n=1 Tax=Crassostrea virginica TaxID=6565 RepID=A0A8B8ALV7_CRAVI|nr:uncharacterized protein LOC111103264 [Crassostrea virginica]
MSVDKLSLLSSVEDRSESDASFSHLSRDQDPDLEDRGNAGKSHSEVDFLPLPSAKRYHLFVSYSAEDKEDANKICEHMERRFKMKCMNFERDFVPGKSIDDNIADEMQKSVKVLLILSPNYIQSHWCVIEAREACQLSFKGLSDVNVIPLLLRSVEKELPPFLRSFVYIDAQKELDVPAKIYDAYLNPGSIDPLHKDRTEISQYKSSGAFLCQKFAAKTSFLDDRFAYRFPKLEDHEIEKFASFDLDPVECVKHYDYLTKDLNGRLLLQNYKVFATNHRYLVLFLLVSLVLLVFAGMVFVALRMQLTSTPTTYDNDLPIGLTSSIGITSVLILIPCFLCCVPFCRKKLSWSFHDIILQHNKKFYKKSRCLISFEITDLLKPALNIFKYDVTECQTYIITLLGKKKPTTNEDEITRKADELMEAKLRDLQLSNNLMDWTKWPESAIRRHQTRNNRKCLCEMVEDDWFSENSIRTRGIIQRRPY